jgi:hypothetical protein
MKLDSDSFPIDVIDFENKKVLVRSDQTESTQGKNVVVDHSAAPRMVKPKNPEVRVWKVNGGRKQAQKIKPTVIMLLEKYTSPKANNVSNRLGGVKRSKSPCGPGGHERWRKTSYDQQPCYPMEPAYWGCAPPMCPQFSPWGFNPWALYTSGPAAYFQSEWVPAGPIYTENHGVKKGTGLINKLDTGMTLYFMVMVRGQSREVQIHVGDTMQVA